MNKEIKIAIYSDTHCRTDLVHPDPDEIALVLHTGDIAENETGNLQELKESLEYFNQFYRNTPKVMIAGNHDFSLALSPEVKEARDLLKEYGWIYLGDSGTVIDIHGHQISIWGMPYMPQSFGVFNLSDEERKKHIDRIPFGTEILLTHCGPYGILSSGVRGIEFGDGVLLNRLPLLKNIKLHAFGHIHEDRGTLSTGEMLFVNSAFGNIYRKPIVVSWPSCIVVSV